MYAYTPEDGTKSHYRWLRATIGLLGIDLRTSGRADRNLSHLCSPTLKDSYPSGTISPNKLPSASCLGHGMYHSSREVTDTDVGTIEWAAA